MAFQLAQTMAPAMLFGVEKLGKTITMSDLSDQDRNVLYRGRMQVLKEKDRSGKTVLCTVVENGETTSANSTSIVSVDESIDSVVKGIDAQAIFLTLISLPSVSISFESCTT
ncbi:MAG: hypothetical protein SGARI_006031 [Bacillariaceae sp.]